MTSSKGIITQVVKYGDTSLIVTIYTQSHGILSCMMKGARQAGKAGVLCQVGNIVTLSFTYQSQKSFQFVKEINLAYTPTSYKNSIAKLSMISFICEVLQQVTKHYDHTGELYEISVQNIQYIHEHEISDLLLIPHHYCIQLMHELGYGFQNNYEITRPYFHLLHGSFESAYAGDLLSCSMIQSKALDELSITQFPIHTTEILSLQQRRDLLDLILIFMKSHLPSIGVIKSHKMMQVIHG